MYKDDFTIHCQNCSISQLCLPFSLNSDELDKLDNIIQRKKPFQKGACLFEAGETLNSLYAVRSGSFKSYTITPEGEEQITSFHLPGDLIGFDAVNQDKHPTYAQALETSMVCEIPYKNLDQLSAVFPKLRHQVMRLMSNEILQDQNIMLLLNRRTAEQKLSYFINDLSTRFAQRGLSHKTFRLTMTRAEIGNYLGLTIETISRLLTKFQKEGIIAVEGKFITILEANLLHSRCTES